MEQLLPGSAPRGMSEDAANNDDWWAENLSAEMWRRYPRAFAKWNAEEEQRLLADFLAGTVLGWQIAWPQFTSTPTATCNGFLIGHEVVSTHKDLFTVSVKVKLTGEPVLTNFA